MVCPHLLRAFLRYQELFLIDTKNLFQADIPRYFIFVHKQLAS